MEKRIVIIEDDRDILELLTIIFTQDGYHVSPFSTGKTATFIGELAPDIILLDINIIGYERTGDQICSELKALMLTSKIPVMLLSAEKNLEQLSKVCQSDAFMAKPFDIDLLLAKARHLAA